MHTKSFIHRDIKPNNFLIGLGDEDDIIYIIDFGLSRQYVNPKTKVHIPMITSKGILGTARYVSLNTHLGLELSRRDDLESIGYMLVYLGKGLPWENLNEANIKLQCDKIKEGKELTTTQKLCEGLPKQFVTYFDYCKKLQFIDEPDYSYLKELFRDSITENGFVRDYKFDWVKERNEDIILSNSESDLEINEGNL